jgi:hypothetical protein
MGMFDSITNAVSDIGGAVTGNAGLIGTVAGGYFGGPVGAQLGGMLGGAIQGGPSGGQMVQGGLQAYGGNLIGQANQEAQQNAARGAQFRPVGVTNTFGTSNYQFDPKTGQLTGAGYNLSAPLQNAQNTLMGGLGTNLQDTANIQAMGRQYMAQSPQEQAQQYMANQQALLRPSRDMAQANLNTSMFNSGTGGLSTAQGGNLGMANPQQQALANAQAMQDLQLAAQATQAGQQQYQFGQGLLSSAYDPYKTGLSAASATEQLGQQPFVLSNQLGTAAAQAGSNAAPYVVGSQYSPTGQMLAGGGMSNLLGQSISNLFGGGNAPAWTTGSDVIPTSTFSSDGGNIDELLGQWASPTIPMQIGGGY